MRLGLKCSCGHELDFEKKILEFFIGSNQEHLVIKCYVCRKETLVRRAGDELASYRITSIEGKHGELGRVEWDTNPISSCPIPCEF